MCMPAWKSALRLCLAALVVALAPPRPAGAAGTGVDIPTFHGDEARLGWTASETRLMPAAVRSGAFGLLWHAPLDGSVPGSPLYASDVDVAGQKHAVVYAATDNNSVFALDAATGHTLWTRSKLREPISDAQFWGSWFGEGRHGILSTPVLDKSAGTLYVCTIRAKGLRQQFEVWGLDMHTGEVRPGWPVVLKGVYKGVAFAPGEVMQRGALSLVAGWVYVPFGGRGDTPPWRGWVIGVDTQHPAAPTRAFCASPDTDGGGIWSGGGLSADRAGSLFAVTGNGDYDASSGGSNLAQSVLRLTPDRADTLGFIYRTQDYYTPSNVKYLDEEDEDLGGATALVLPDQPATRTPHLLFTGGKDGLAYLLNRDNLGGLGGELQKFRLFADPNATYHEGIRATSSYFDAGAAGRFLYVAGDNPGPDRALGIVALQLVSAGPNAPTQMKRVWTLKESLNLPSSPFVSSDGATNGIVWIVETNEGRHSSLRAYDALTGAELYNSNAGPATDHFDDGKRFTSPIIADGRVFVGAGGILCYGLRATGGKGGE
jgi:hypothetical protein